MEFSYLLKLGLNKKNITRKDLIIKLQLDYEEFNGVDAITLSRWINGKTKPSMYRQFLISIALDFNFVDFLDSIDIPKISISFQKVQEKWYDIINSVYHSISYAEENEVEPNIIYKNISDFANQNNHLTKFYNNISSYRALRERMESDSFVMRNHAFIVDKREGTELNIRAHCCYSLDVSILNTYWDMNENLENSVLINVGFAPKTEIYEMLQGVLLNQLIRILPPLGYCYLAIRGMAAAEFYLEIGGEIIKILPEAPHVGNIYILKIQLVKFVGHPYSMYLIKEHKDKYLELMG